MKTAGTQSLGHAAAQRRVSAANLSAPTLADIAVPTAPGIHSSLNGQEETVAMLGVLSDRLNGLLARLEGVNQVQPQPCPVTETAGVLPRLISLTEQARSLAELMHRQVDALDQYI